jgi:hypothetical protein
MFSEQPRASAPVFIFCVPGLIFSGTKGVESRFHLLRARNRFRRNRGRRLSFSCFESTDSFSAVSRASGPVFMFCAPGLVFGGMEGVGSRFHVLRSRTNFQRYRRVSFHVLCARSYFRRYRGYPVPFSYFTLRDSFSAVPRASGPVFMSYAPGHVFSGAKGVGSFFSCLAFPD